jgi:hypothetical protein
MKFRCKTDQWRQYRGYVFTFGRPTEVTDRGSIEAISMHPDFERVQEPVEVPRTLEDAIAPRETLTLPKRRGRPPKNEAIL